MTKILYLIFNVALGFKVGYEPLESQKDNLGETLYPSRDLNDFPDTDFENSEDSFDEDDITEPSDDVITSHGGSGVYVFNDLTQESRPELDQIGLFEKHLKDGDKRYISKTVRQRNLVRDKNSRPMLIYYNRIPKCGSTFFTSLLNKTSEYQKLYSVKNFHHRGIRFSFKNDHEKRRFFQEIEKEITSKSKSTLYVRHQYFTDFHEYQIKSKNENFKNSDSVFYMNMLRDPVERFISEFYYKRHGSEQTVDVENLSKVTGIKNRNLTLNDCVSQRKQECTSVKQTLTMFFCGQDDDCIENSHRPKALEKAKANLINVYDFIGVHERFEDSIRILEASLPNVMKGLYSNYKLMQEETGQVTRKKGKVAELSKRVLRKHLKNDVDLYEFARVVFHKRYAKFQQDGLI